MPVKSIKAKARRADYHSVYVRTHRSERNAYLRAWCKNNPELRYLRYLRHRLKSKYGLTIEQYHAILKRQHGLCAICGMKLRVSTPEERLVRYGNMAVVDHKGKVVRGILCNNCNRGIGLLGENIATLRRAIRYLSIRRD